MSTMGHIYHQCPKCSKTLVSFTELSYFEAAGTPKFSDGIYEYFATWNSGYLKECPECKHIDIPRNFQIPDDANFDYQSADPGSLNSLRSVCSSRKIDNWLANNKVSQKIEFNIRFSAYNRERVKDVEIKREMLNRQKNSKRLFEIAFSSSNPELLFQTTEICRGSSLVSEAIRLITKLESEFPDWNPNLVKEVKSLIGQSNTAPKMIKKIGNGIGLADI